MSSKPIIEPVAPEMNQGSILRILLQNFVFCTVIALILWQFVPSVGQYGFFSNFVHAQAIGNSIALLAVALSRWASTAGFSGRWEHFLSIVVATVLGVVIGLWIAGTVLGLQSRPLAFLDNTDHLVVSAVTAIIASLAFNWHRYRREKMIRLQLIASEEKRRADIAHHAMLRAQLDPHMLFNTLANLRALIGHDTEQALAMLDRLDSFLRETLSSSRSTNHSLANEMKLLNNYMALMKIRMANRLTYSFNIAEECNNIQIPALLLQPLVENAIRHGLEPLIEGGHVNIDAYVKNDKLTLIVEDNGTGTHTGISDSLGDVQLVTNLNDIEDGGFGLQNLHRRLQQTYDNNASINFAHATDDGKCASGTRVTIQLPAPLWRNSDRISRSELL